jgi:hypothetical protein
LEKEAFMGKTIGFVALAFTMQVVLFGAIWQARARAQSPHYAAMAPLSQYLMSESSEIALARTAAPPSISHNATVMVLGRDGYTVAVKGTNGFLCLVERSWSNPTSASDYWSPRDRAPTCFNPAAAKTFEPIYFLKTRLALSGKSREEIHRAIESAFDHKQLPALEPGAMSYMMSKQQYIHPGVGNWYPHVMLYRIVAMLSKKWSVDHFFDAAATPEGAALFGMAGSRILSGTIFSMVAVGYSWSSLAETLAL